MVARSFRACRLSGRRPLALRALAGTCLCPAARICASVPSTTGPLVRVVWRDCGCVCALPRRLCRSSGGSLVMGSAPAGVAMLCHCRSAQCARLARRDYWPARQSHIPALRPRHRIGTDGSHADKLHPYYAENLNISRERASMKLLDRLIRDGRLANAEREIRLLPLLKWTGPHSLTCVGRTYLTGSVMC